MSDTSQDPAAPDAPEEASPARAPSGRDLQENESQGPLETTPGSDADQAAEVPHVG